MQKKIHIVSFQNPCPPTYGGVIDVYYKLFSLKKAGYYVVLHSFCYKERMKKNDALLEIADEVYLYHRNESIITQFSYIPYIVNSRRDKRLKQNLLQDEAPILFEGLHSCFFLSDLDFANRLKIVRTHNIEHDYYWNLCKATKKIKEKLFFSIEALRLKGYERVLRYADYIATITDKDKEYFSEKYPDINTFLLPCFYNDAKLEQLPGEGNYVLCHGNLSVQENVKALMWIMENIIPLLPNVNFVFAGSNPERSLKTKCKEYDNIQLVENPTQEEMDKLLIGAHVHLLVTFQATGIKLKLLNSLCRGAFVVANSKMTQGTGLEAYCYVANTPKEIANLIYRAMTEEFTEEMYKNRKILENHCSIKPLLKILEDNQNN